MSVESFSVLTKGLLNFGFHVLMSTSDHIGVRLPATYTSVERNIAETLIFYIYALLLVGNFCNLSNQLCD